MNRITNFVSLCKIKILRINSEIKEKYLRCELKPNCLKSRHGLVGDALN